LEVDAIRPNLRNVTSLQIQQDLTLGTRIYGDVILQAGNNVRITQEVGDSVTVLRFDAIDGEGLSQECVCGGETAQSPIYTINGIPPTEDGDFSILGSDCLSVISIANGVQLVDKCSAPCCGCEELEILTDALEIFGRQLTTLDTFLRSLESRVIETGQTLLASKFGDRGCMNYGLVQQAYRGREDDALDGTWIADENTPWHQSVGVNFRIVFAVGEESDVPTENRQFGFQYYSFTHDPVWRKVTTNPSEKVFILASPHYADEDPKNEELNGKETFTGGVRNESTEYIGENNQIDYNGLDWWELECVFQINGGKAADGEDIEIRVVKKPTGVLDRYDEHVLISVDNP